MRVPRVYVDQPLVAGRALEVDQTVARHLTRVLRLRPGAELRVFDGLGTEHNAHLVSVARDRTVIETGKCIATDNESPLHVTLAQGISRGERMDFVMQKATELGVTHIAPLLTEHSIVRLDHKRADKRHTHWRGIVIGACEQSGRSRLPLLDKPQAFDDWLAALPRDGNRIMLTAGASHRPADLPRPADDKLTIIIGPEGGLSERERDVLGEHGFVAVALGPRILRTETAALAILAIAQSLWGDSASGPVTGKTNHREP